MLGSNFFVFYLRSAELVVSIAGSFLSQLLHQPFYDSEEIIISLKESIFFTGKTQLQYYLHLSIVI